MVNRILIIILAGGKSSRMGQDKALLKYQGKPLLARISEIALSCGDQVYVVTPWTEKYQNILPVSCQLIKEKEGEFPGALVAFYQALKIIKTQRQWVLLLACDLPNLQENVIQNWITQLEQIPPEVIAFLPKHQERWECLSGFYRCSCLPLLEKFIQQGGRSFQKWLKSYPVAEIPVDDPQLFFNCNTPEDYQKI